MNHLSHRELRNQLSERSRSAPPIPYDMATLDSLESQNEERIEGLGAKVRILKDITVAIGDEVRDSSKILGSMNEAFDSTRVLLGGTMRRMERMARKQGVGWFMFMCFLGIAFCFFIYVWLF